MSLLDSFFPDPPNPLASLRDREDEARRVVNSWALGGGALSAVTGNRWALAAADLAMISGVARAFGIRSYSTEAVVGVVGTTLARECAGILPDFGSTFVRSAINAAVIKTVGEAVIDHFRAEAARDHLDASGRGRINGLEKIK